MASGRVQVLRGETELRAVLGGRSEALQGLAALLTCAAGLRLTLPTGRQAWWCSFREEESRAPEWVGGPAQGPQAVRGRTDTGSLFPFLCITNSGFLGVSHH